MATQEDVGSHIFNKREWHFRQQSLSDPTQVVQIEYNAFGSAHIAQQESA